MSVRSFTLLLSLFFTFSSISAQISTRPQTKIQRLYKGGLNHEPSWYGSSESLNVADNVLLLQKDNGGWPKNIFVYWNKFTPEEIQTRLEQKHDIKMGTIDNSATCSELSFLGKMYQVTKNEIYKSAFQRGLSFIFHMQYDNGGFKQFDTNVGYYTHITFNDNATYNVMQLLRAVTANDSPYTGMANDTLRYKAKKAFDKGIDCILNTQYIQNGIKTIWCAQHDEVTLMPAKARAYELPSLSGFESAGIVQILMDIPNPDQRVKDAVVCAIEWFDKNRIKDHKLEFFVNKDGQKDLRWVESKGSPDYWGRFNELDSNRPFVSDRDGIVKYDISEIGFERRTGYGWYTREPAKVLARFPEWKSKNLK